MRKNGIEKIDKQRKPGGQPGNRNAFKTGLYAKEPRALRKQIAAWKRTTRALLRQIEEASSPPHKGGDANGITNNPS